MNSSKLKIFLVFLGGFVLTGAANDFPWHEYTVDVPNTKEQLHLAVRRNHPFLAEYEYKVSGTSAVGKPFIQKLTQQTGGDAYLTIDYIPAGDGSAACVAFCLAAEEGPKSTYERPRVEDVLDLSKGLLEHQTTLSEHKVSLGFIGSDMKYYKPTIWNELHALAGRKFHHRDYRVAIDANKKALAEAEKRQDDDLIATSLYDLANCELQATPNNSAEVEKLYLEALQKSNNGATNREDGADVRPSWVFPFALGAFYEEHNQLAKANELVERSISLAQKLSVDKETILKELKLELARIELLEHRGIAAELLLSEIEPENPVRMVQKHLQFGECCPYIVLLEHEIGNNCPEERTGKSYSVTAAFNIDPSGKMSEPKIVESGGQYADFMAMMGLFRAATSTRPSFPTTMPINCKVHLKWDQGQPDITIEQLATARLSPNSGAK